MRDTIIRIFIYLRVGGLFLSLFFLGGIIYYLRKIHPFQKWRNKWYSQLGVSPIEVLSNLEKKKWTKIEKLLNEPYQSSWKLAALQADGVIERTLQYIQLNGQNFEQHIESLKKQGYRNLDIILQYHQLVGNILSDQHIPLSLQQAQTICNTYKTFWQELTHYLLENH